MPAKGRIALDACFVIVALTMGAKSAANPVKGAVPAVFLAAIWPQSHAAASEADGLLIFFHYFSDGYEGNYEIVNLGENVRVSPNPGHESLAYCSQAEAKATGPETRRGKLRSGETRAKCKQGT